MFSNFLILGIKGEEGGGWEVCLGHRIIIQIAVESRGITSQ